MKPIYLEKLLKLINYNIPSANKVICGISVDSRLTKHGDLFFALPGEKTDGHAFLEHAAAQGAQAALVSSNYSGPNHGLILIRSMDILNDLHTLTKNYLKQSKFKIVGITGSLGKTTTKEFVTTLLKKKYNVFSSTGNHNSKIGLPLTILNYLELDKEVLVLEMGMTHPGDISKLIEIAPPTIALITTIELVHAQNFNSLEEIAQAKSEIFSHPDTQLCIFPACKNVSGILSSHSSCKKISFSTEKPSDYFLKLANDGLTITSNTGERILFPPLHVPGTHNCHNFLAAVTIAKEIGMEWEEIKAAQNLLVLPERRLQPIEKKGILFINDSYNASEASLKSALDSLPKPKPEGRRIAVIGGIAELGKFSDQCHQAVAEHALDKVDCLFCLGDECEPMYTTWKQANRLVHWFKTRSELTSVLRMHAKTGDVVLLKGSRGKELWKILDEI